MMFSVFCGIIAYYFCIIWYAGAGTFKNMCLVWEPEGLNLEHRILSILTIEEVIEIAPHDNEIGYSNYPFADHHSVTAFKLLVILTDEEMEDITVDHSIKSNIKGCLKSRPMTQHEETVMSTFNLLWLMISVFVWLMLLQMF